MDERFDQAAECVAVIDFIIVTDVDSIPRPAMGEASGVLFVQAVARLPVRPFVPADYIDARPLSNELVAIVLANVGKFVRDALGPQVDVVGSYTDIVVGDLIAFVDRIGQGRRCDKTKGENSQNNNEQATK